MLCDSQINNNSIGNVISGRKCFEEKKQDLFFSLELLSLLLFLSD